MELLKKELESEAGEVTGLYEKDGKLHALEAWWGLGKKRRAVLLQHIGNKAFRYAPGIMVRITDVRSLLEVIGLNENAPGDKISGSSFHKKIRLFRKMKDAGCGNWEKMEVLWNG